MPRPLPALLLTRPAAASDAIASECRAAGFAGRIEIAPILDLVPRPGDIPGGALIFTSRAAIDVATARADLTGRRGFAVGAQTAAAARAAGMVCEDGPGDAAALVRQIVALRPPGPLIHLRGAHRAADLAGALRAAGINATEQVLYDQPPRPLTTAALTLLAGTGPVILPLFSPRSAMLLAAACPVRRAPCRPIAFSAAVARGWTGAGAPEPPVVLSRPDRAAMLAAILAPW